MNLKTRLIRIKKNIIIKIYNKLFRNFFNKFNNKIFYINNFKINNKINIIIIYYKIN